MRTEKQIKKVIEIMNTLDILLNKEKIWSSKDISNFLKWTLQKENGKDKDTVFATKRK
ncbi:hypothetical protein LCGC14_2697860 [marine sediment metagenome]|uniref:Uncharacterized protein n=1 Tax=marine sediment metagenome TaxID=412755 RepID=A0A0F9C8H9_9ZZZZ